MVFLDLKNRGSLAGKILSNERVDPYLKEFTFKCFKFIWNRQFFHVLLINAHSFIYKPIDRFAFFFETYIKTASLV